MVLLLKAELSDGKADESVVIGLESMPLNENVEQSHCIGQSALEVGPNAVSDLLEMADRCQHREDGLDDHAAIPLTAPADFEIGRMPVLLLKPLITEDHHLVGHGVNQVLESRSVVDIGCVTGPIHDQTEVIDQITQLAANNPARVGLAFPADLLSAASFTARVDQLDAIAVDDAEQRRLGHEALSEIPMRVERPKQTGPLRQFRQQVSEVSPQPPIEGPVAHPLEGKQQRQRHHFTGIQVGLRMLGYVQHLVIHTAEQFDDKIFGGHGVPLSLSGSRLTASENLVPMSN